MAETFSIPVVQNAVGTVAGNWIDRILERISNPIILVFKMEANVEKLKKQVAELNQEIDHVEQFTQAVERRGEEIVQKLKNWRDGAVKFIEALNAIDADKEKAKKKCFFGLCLNPLSRYKLSKKAVEDSKDIADLVGRARQFNLPPSYPPIPQRELAAPVKGFQEFESRMDVLDEIMEALQSPSINIIGLHGMPGVGKTMLLKEVKRKVEQEKLFDAVAMASVTKNLDLRKIQDKIAFDLDLELPDLKEPWRAASRLKEKLRKKKVLVILDDVWARIDFEEVGIPIENKQKMDFGISSSAEGHMKCKILLASRDSYVLSTDQMGTGKVFAVGELIHQEPWQMFKKMVGERAESHELQSTAIEIVKECGGLPIAIATLANALKSKSLPEWENALTKLRNPSPNNFTSNSATGSVYTAIEVSYTHLGDDLHKQTFLLSSLMGHNASIQDLLKYGVGLGLCPQSNTIEEARNEVITRINNLKASSLLIDGSDRGHFDVHDVIRDVAISIANRDHHGWFLEDDRVPTEWSDKDAVKDFKWLCLQDVTIDELPDELESPQLTFFRFSSKNPSLEIPANFFRGVQRLKVMDLTLMHMSSLPPSICLLSKLRTLCLHQGLLGDIRIIGELKNLEILSLLKSDIKKLPREFAQLTRLKLLDLGDCTKLKVILPCVLASMSRLEELYLGNSFDRWEQEERENQQNVGLGELKQLKKLVALEVGIRDVKMIPEDLFFENLKRYKIFIGDAWNKWDGSPQSSRILKLQLRASISLDSSVKQLLKTTEELHLRELKGLKNILYELDSEGFPELKHLYIQNAPGIQHIIDSVGLNAFPTLEVLFIHSLINLEKICYSQLRTTSFCRLRIITIECCNQLKKLFSFSTARQLLQLQEIGVTDCRNMIEIFYEGGKENVGDIVEATDQMVGLGKLLYLRLQNLPKFISFSHENCTSSRHVSLFSDKFVFPKLEKLQLSWIKIATVWHTSATSYCTQNLTELIVEDCHNLEHLFSSSMARGLVNLSHLKINQCKKMREIIVTENVENMENSISFPKLDFLQIQDLQNLVRFYSGNCIIEVPSLKRLIIENCPNLKEFTVKSLNTDVATDITPLFNEQIKFTRLEFLSMSLNIQPLWLNRYPEIMPSFAQKLKELTVDGCGNLRYLLTGFMVKSFEHLESLNIKDCKMMEEVIVAVEEGSMQKMFPNLQTLKLSWLPNLTSFCAGNYIEFPNLTKLDIDKCPMLKTFISSPVIGDTVASSVKAENNCSPPLFDEKVAFPQLEMLMIVYMGHLNKIWADQPEKDSFHKLKSLFLGGCGMLVSIFPSTMLVRLKELEVLLISGCDSLEDIVEGSSASDSQAPAATQSTLVETDTKFLFPKLARLKFHKLPKLKGFCHPTHTKCRNLKTLEVIGCEQVQVFAAEFPSSGDDQLEIQIECPLFWVTKATFSSLEELKLTCNGTMMKISRGQHPRGFFPKLRSLELINCCEQSASLQSFIVPLPNFQKLVVSEASSTEFLHHEYGKLDHEENPALALVRLSELRSSTENKLTYLWKEELHHESVFYNLTALEVLERGKLKNFMPSFISFHNLHTLELSRCHKLKNLIRYSTARSLVQLTKMGVIDCAMMEEIVACMDDEVKDGIVFNQLKSLQLCGLQRLTRFCSGNCSFEFPSLEEVIVMRCPKMQFFSMGKLVTPELSSVNGTGDVDNGRWEGDLNTTIRELFTHKVGYYMLENLKISESEHDHDQAIIEIWSRNSSEMLPFSKLKSLEVSNYSGWRFLLTPSMALGLVHLKDLKVTNCAKMEHVISGDGAEEVFPQLNSISLESCSNLTCFYEGSSMLKFPSLKQITVVACEAMVAFASGSSKGQDNVVTTSKSEERRDIPIQRFFNNKLEVLNLETLKLSRNINIQQIWHNHVPEMSSFLRNLKECTLEGCGNLKYLLTSSMVKSLEHLKCLIVRDCKMMEGVIVIEGFAEEERTHKISFPKLEHLELIALPKLTRFCSGNYIKFPWLTNLVIRQCPLLKTFTSSPVIGDMAVNTEREDTSTTHLFDAKVAVPMLQFLVISHLENLDKIWHNQLDEDSFCKLYLVKVEECESLKSIFPFNMLERLQGLKELLIRRCDSLEEIFEPQGPIPSYSQALVDSQQTSVETDTMLVLQKSTKLELRSLPKLKGFYHPIHITKFLKKLEVIGFQQLEIFALEISSLQSTTSDDNLETRLPHSLFWINKDTFSSLEELTLAHNDILREIWHGQYPGDYFPKLKVLELICLHEHSVVPPLFFHLLPNLEKLVVTHVSFHEIFQCEGPGGEGRPVDALTQLTELRLSHLNELKHIWKEKSDLERIVYKLRALEVLECNKLMNLVPSIISLRNLQTLEVTKCHGLSSLVKYSAAKNLVQLTRMSISM